MAAALFLGQGQAYHGTGLVQGVNGLVRQGFIRNVAVGQAHGGLYGIVGVGDAMEFLVFGLELLQNSNGLRNVRGFHHNLLETAVQRTVLFHNLGEFVQGSGTDALEFSARQRRLEHVGGIQAAGSAAGSHDGVELVNEQDQVRVLRGFFDDGLEAFFKIAPVFGTGHYGGDIQGKDAFFCQRGGDVAGGDALGDTLHNGAFSHAGLADEHGVVLFAPAQNLDDAGNFRVAAYHRVQLALAGCPGEVIGKLLNVQLFLLCGFLFRSLGGLFGVLLVLRLLLLRAQKAFVFHVGQEASIVYPVRAQVHLSVALRGAAQGQEQMLGCGRRALEPGGFHDGDTEHVLRLARETDVVNLLVRDGLVGEYALVDKGFEVGRLNGQVLQRLERRILLVADDAQEQMVRAYPITAGAHGFLPRVFNDQIEVFGNFQLHEYKNNQFPLINNRARYRKLTKCQNCAGTVFVAISLCYEENPYICAASLRYRRRSTEPGRYFYPGQNIENFRPCHQERGHHHLHRP